MTPDQFEDLEIALNKIAADEEWQQRVIVLPTGIKIQGVFTAEELKGYREQFEKGEACKHCGGLHLRACPRVRRIVMRNREEISEVEFWRDGQWDDEHVIWPEEVYEEDLPDSTAEISVQDGT